MNMFIFVWSTALLWLGLQPHAQADAAPQSYALVVGSNRGGEGQHTLAYAERDAERMGALLVELGRVPKSHLRVLTAPTAAALRSVLAGLKDALRAHGARGERTQLVFYYSGHARSQSLSLGDEELSLDEVRAALARLPSSLTVVVLDACQSGAFSGVKGARPSEDFSAVSVSSLKSEGLAVMASSTAAELSQESQELGAGYFTHHLMVGMRGAGDVDRDGRVSLDEAYRYAYTQTLSATARTRVGTQHATLETAISGRGDVPLTYPVDADAQLALPPGVAGRVLIELPGRRAVIAELEKVQGSELSLALPHGHYEVFVREERGDGALQCAVALPTGGRATLDTAGCARVRLDADTHKKDGRREPHERWFAELGMRYLHYGEDAYTRTLEDFGYGSSDERRSPGFRLIRRFRFSTAVGLGVHRQLAVLVRYDGLESDFYRTTDSVFDSILTSERIYSYRSRAVQLGVRARLPQRAERVVPFAEADLGLGFARTELTVGEAGEAPRRERGPAVRAALGVTLGGTFAGYLSLGFIYAPVLENLLGERRNVGGAFLETGVHFRTLGGH